MPTGGIKSHPLTSILSTLSSSPPLTSRVHCREVLHMCNILLDQIHQRWTQCRKQHLKTIRCGFILNYFLPTLRCLKFLSFFPLSVCKEPFFKESRLQVLPSSDYIHFMDVIWDGEIMVCSRAGTGTRTLNLGAQGSACCCFTRSKR